MPIDLGDPTVRSLEDIVLAFDKDKVIWLFLMLGLEFLTGVIVAFRKNIFDWDQIFEIAKKNIIIAAAWGAAFVYSENAGNIVYGLSLLYVGGGLVTNITALLGSNVGGTLGQVLTKGPGDGGDTSGNTATPVQIDDTPPVVGGPTP